MEALRNFFWFRLPSKSGKKCFYDQCSDLNAFTQLSLHDLSEKVRTHLPFKKIVFIQRERYCLGTFNAALVMGTSLGNM